MSGSSIPPLRAIGLFAAIAILGGLCGAAAHSAFRGKGSALSVLPTGAAHASSSASGRGEANQARRVRRERSGNEDDLTFSAKQWDQIVTKPDFLKLSAGDCFAGSHALEGLAAGEEPPEGKRGPDLFRHRPFFGWDKEKRAAVQEAYYQFGKAVRESQGRHRHVDYHGNGKATIRFADASGELDAHWNKLSADLRQILGEKDTMRLTTLTPIHKVWEPIDVSVSFSGDTWAIVSRTDGESGGFWTPGSKITDRPAPGYNLETSFHREWLDWKRLFNEAEEKGEGQ